MYIIERNIFPKWLITSSFLANSIEANVIKIVRNNATPTYSKINLAGTSSTFKMFPKIKSNIPIMYGKTLFNCVIFLNSYKQSSIKIKNSEIKEILLYRIENIKTLTKTNPESARLKSFFIKL